jgi:hypothetical protein
LTVTANCKNNISRRDAETQRKNGFKRINRDDSKRFEIGPQGLFFIARYARAETAEIIVSRPLTGKQKLNPSLRSPKSALICVSSEPGGGFSV